MKKLVRYSKPYYIYIITAALASIGTSVSNVWIIDILKDIIDESVYGNIVNVKKYLLTGAAAIIFGMVSNYLVIFMTGYYGAGILRDLRIKSVERLSRVSPDYMEKNNFGDIVARLSSDIGGVAGYLETYFKDCIYVPIITVVFAIYLVSISPVPAVLCIFPLTILVPLSVKLMKPVKLSQMEYVRMLGNTNNNIQEAYDGADIVKSYNLQRTISDKYYHDLKKTFDLSMNNDLRQYNLEPVSNMISDLPIAIALCVGGFMVFRGEMTIGLLIAFVSASKKLIEPLGRAYQLVVKTQMAMVSVDRVFYVLDAPVEENTDKPLLKESNCENIFEIKNVTFTYEGMSERNTAVSDISLSIKKGSKTAFVGRSGSGKSTLLKLLYRHYEVTDGNISYYGNDYKTINPVLLRNDISLISQETVIFPMSIEDNIRIGRPDASNEEVIKAAEISDCMEFINKLPDGMNTMSGEKGTLLSGGQKQRIAIARAVLKNTEVLFLDEPTSALDRESEETVNAALLKTEEGKTVVAVTHRLTTIRDFDNIAVMDSGRIAEQGTHEELMKLHGQYYRMYNEYSVSGGIIS